jgi:hypothetical protein
MPAGGGVDPFAAAPAGAAREVRLVIDDKAVSDSEVGRGRSVVVMIAAFAAAIAGIAVGWFVGSTWRERQLYDLVLADAKEVYKTATDAAPKVEQAQKLVDQALKAAAPAPGKTVDVDFKALEDLRKLEKPFPADAFSRKHYRAFGTATVDALFTYYNNTNLLWSKFATITAKSLSPAAREGLTRAAKNAGELASTEFGCVPFKDGDLFGCGLVSVIRNHEGKESAEATDGKGKGKGKDKDKDGEPKLTVVTRGGSYPKEQYAGQDLSSKTSDYVIMVDKGRSNEILGAQTNQFQTYARDLMEAKTLADQTVEIQGRLIQQLGDIAKLQSLN